MNDDLLSIFVFRSRCAFTVLIILIAFDSLQFPCLNCPLGCLFHLNNDCICSSGVWELFVVYLVRKLDTQFSRLLAGLTLRSHAPTFLIEFSLIYQAHFTDKETFQSCSTQFMILKNQAFRIKSDVQLNLSLFFSFCMNLHIAKAGPLKVH